MMKNLYKDPGVIRLDTAWEAYSEPCRIIGIIWEGATTAGDTAELRGNGPSANRILWRGRTDTTNTYLGSIWGKPGIAAPDGFALSHISAGVVLVYLSE